GLRVDLDGARQLDQTQDDQDRAGHDRRDDQPVQPVRLDDPVDDHYERTGRAADLDARAAQERDQEPGDDRREEPALGTYAARDRERDRERERHDPDDRAGREIRDELLT